MVEYCDTLHIERGEKQGIQSIPKGGNYIMSTRPTVSVEEHEQLERELAEKEKALAEMTVMFTALKKK